VRFTTVLIVAVAGAVAASLAVFAPVDGQPKIPADFNYELGKDSPGMVKFSHQTHKDAGADKCNACHTKIFKMKKGQTGTPTMAKMKAGEQCGACHNGKMEMGGKKVFAVDDKTKCETCHQKKA
jgi:c(7)-type cytochrome triheme protein